MHVLITRPVQDSEPFKTRLEEMGCRVTLAPLMATVSNDMAADALSDGTGLIATSRNALAALAESPALSMAVKLPLYVVGPGTAAFARERGFSEVIEGSGRVEALVPILAALGQ